MNPMRVYIDTSVFGGYYDEDFQAETRRFFDAVLAGKVTALISDTLVGELVSAPDHVEDLLQRVIDAGCERLPLHREAKELRDAYLSAGVVTANYADDALHVAHATVARADVIVSWNFRHLVNPLRIRGFNGVNAAQGYGPVVIMTPEDLSHAWKEEDDEEDE